MGQKGQIRKESGDVTKITHNLTKFVLPSLYLKAVASLAHYFCFFGSQFLSYQPHLHMVQIVWWKPATFASSLPFLKVLLHYNMPSIVVVNSCGCNCFHYKEANLFVLKWWQNAVYYNSCLQNPSIWHKSRINMRCKLIVVDFLTICTN